MWDQCQRSDFAVTALLLLARRGRASSMREATTVRSLSASSRPAKHMQRLARISMYCNDCYFPCSACSVLGNRAST